MCGTLVISGGIGLYFAYQENKAALASLQREKASSAAARIEDFVRQIERQLEFAALPQLGGLEQRLLEFQKVLRVAQAVTDIAYIDEKGREQLYVSRLAMNVVGGGKDRSQEPSFAEAKPGQTWFGKVYFRKDTEPYISMAVRTRDKGPVTLAEVNLKFIWDVVTRIRVGEKGKAYVVDGTGHLVAHPDIGLVLRKTNLSHLEQVQRALRPGAGDSEAMLATDVAGNKVLTAFAPTEDLRWKVFVEQPEAEVFAALDATILRTVALLVAGLLFSALAALSLARSMVRPIATLQEGAARIGAGDLDQSIDVRTGDELESLADEFNRMSARLRESYAGLEKKVEERTAELQQSLEQQTATSDILQVISTSPTQTGPVFDAIIRNAVRLARASFGSVFTLQEGIVSVGAHYNLRPDAEAAFRKDFPQQLHPGSPFGRAMSSCEVVNVPDMDMSGFSTASKERSRAMDLRAVLAVPMMRAGSAVGAIAVGGKDSGAFKDAEIALLKSFADQAVIAIENVRLFNETKEALEQQTATSDILQVTSKSPTDVKPVFDTILANTLRLCEGSTAVLWTFDGQKLRIGAHLNMTEGAIKHLSENPLEPGDWNPTAQAALERRTVHVLDVFAEPRYRPLVPSGTTNTRPNAGTVLAVPLLREGELLGVITVWRYEKKLFGEKQLAMVNTFAAQAVIAIENVRLFNETKESLEQQTAISEILRVISSSPSDVQPVLEAVAERAARICDANIADIVLADQGVLRPAAVIGSLGRPSETPLDRSTVMGRSVIDRTTIHVADLHREGAEYPRGQALAKKYGHRTILAVPLLREDRALGTILLRRAEVRPFEDKHIALLKTFADQAAIAIENVRLFNATQEALEQQTATADILKVISGSPTDVQPVFDAIVENASRLVQPCNAGILMREGDMLALRATAGSQVTPQTKEALARVYPVKFDPATTLAARVILERRMMECEDTEAPDALPVVRAAGRAGTYRSFTLIPLMREGDAIGTLGLVHPQPGFKLTPKQLALLQTFADQAVIAIENVRLFNEIQDKSRQLEIANKHKSDFLANMSHELRTPLNAIIGFSEVLSERMFGELNEKQADYLKDIHESGKHLLSLINDILDLSKIEAGRMDLEIGAFDLPSALSNAMTLVRERAQRHGIALGLEVDQRLGELRADERKFKQIVLNLLSNAVKFTPDGGRVDVIAKHLNGSVEIAVRDTGMGIAPEDQAAVFEEFKQVGRDARRKAEGTGLGLALTKRFVELHGGEIRLQSSPGKGSTFTIKLPVQR